MKEILEYIRQKNKGIAIFLSTNAQLPKTLEILEPIGDYFDTLQISIDGTGKVFEEIRIRSNYENFLVSLREICEMSKRKKFEPKLNMVLFEKNSKSMKDVILVAKERGIDKVFFNSMNLVSNDWPLTNYNFY